MSEKKKKTKDLKARLAERRKTLSEKSNSSGFHYLKEGTVRMRPMQTGDKEADFAIECSYFYLGPDIKGVISPMTFDEPCAIMEAYNKLKDSKKEPDRAMAKKIKPKTRWAMVALKYADTKASEVDQSGVRLILLTGETYQEVLDLWLDDDEAGDFTDPENGYDLKFSREGTTQFDTKYSVRACKPTAVPKAYRDKTFDIAAMVKAQIPTYEETQEYVEKLFSGTLEDTATEERPKKKKKKNRE